VRDSSSRHQIDYVVQVKNTLNFEGHQNPMIGSKVTVILLNGWFLPSGEVSQGRVCACSLRRRLILICTLLNVLPGTPCLPPF
jgi:hypothetical protein